MMTRMKTRMMTRMMTRIMTRMMARVMARMMTKMDLRMATQSVMLQGLQSQERNLFLFNDLLLIAKERSSSHFKLKDQVTPHHLT